MDEGRDGADGKSVHWATWLTHEGPLLADWLNRYGLHPVHNDLEPYERDLLTHELIADPATRLFAATNGGLTLDVWAAVKTAAYLAALAGGELTLPTRPTLESAGPTADEVASAKAVLDKHSLIANLPVI